MRAAVFVLRFTTNGRFSGGFASSTSQLHCFCIGVSRRSFTAVFTFWFFFSIPYNISGWRHLFCVSSLREATTFQSHDKKNVITVSRVFTSSLQRKEYRHIEWPGGLSSAVCLGLVGGAFSLLQPRCSDLRVVRVLQHGRNIFFWGGLVGKDIAVLLVEKFLGRRKLGKGGVGCVFVSVSYCCLLWLFFGLLSCTIGVGGAWVAFGGRIVHPLISSYFVLTWDFFILSKGLFCISGRVHYWARGNQMVGGVKAHNFLFSGFPFAGPSLYGKISLSYLLLWGVGVLYLGKRPLSVVCVFVVCACWF